jgi:hypothetical protein
MDARVKAVISAVVFLRLNFAAHLIELEPRAPANILPAAPA